METHYRGLKFTQDRRWKDTERLAHIRTDVLDTLALVCYPEGVDHTVADEQYELLLWLYEGYVEAFGVDADWQILEVEYKGSVPVFDTGLDLVFVADLLVLERSTGRKQLVDHKTSGKMPKRQDFDLNDQFPLYAWALGQLGLGVQGAIRSQALTRKNKVKAQALTDRFARYRLHHTKAEQLGALADAVRTIQNVRSWEPGEQPRHLDMEYCAYRCLPGKELVQSPSGVLAVSRRPSDDPVVVLRTKAGRRLAVTPQHPILTQRGWVPASLVVKGDQVVGNSGQEGESRAGVGYDIYHRPTPIEEIFDSALHLKDAVGVSRAGSQFYGEHLPGKVEVVWANRGLSDVPGAKPVRQGILPGSSGYWAGSVGFVLGGDFGCSPHASHQPPTLVDLSFHCTSGYTKASGQVIHRQPSIVQQQHPMGVESRSGYPPSELSEGFSLFRRTSSGLLPSRFGLCPQGDPSFGESFAQCPVGMPSTTRQLLKGYPGPIEFDSVIDIEHRAGPRWVYDMTTPAGWFWAGNIVAHNCDFREACLIGRKSGVTAEQSVLLGSGLQSRERRRIAEPGVSG